MLRHPEVASRSCDECKLWVFDEQGKKQISRGKPVPMGKAKPPCRMCPKKSPEEAHQYELSRKNALTVQMYYTTRAMNGTNLSDEARQDSRLQSNLAIVDRIIRPHEAEQATSAAMALMMAGREGKR